MRSFQAILIVLEKLPQTTPAFIVACLLTRSWCILLSAGRTMLSILLSLLPTSISSAAASAVPSSRRKASGSTGRLLICSCFWSSDDKNLNFYEKGMSSCSTPAIRKKVFLVCRKISHLTDSNLFYCAHNTTLVEQLFLKSIQKINIKFEND